MDEYINCLLSICCPPERRTEVMAKFLITHGVDAHAAESAATVLCECFDFAPKGTLQPFIQAIAKLARGPAFKG